jgi:hypothetical protein
MDRVKRAGVQWQDVWAWCEELAHDYGQWVHFGVHPPMPSDKRHPHGSVSMHTVRYLDGGKAEETVRTRWLPNPDKATAEVVALQLVADLSKELDKAVWEAERASLAAGQLSLW